MEEPGAVPLAVDESPRTSLWGGPRPIQTDEGPALCAEDQAGSQTMGS